TAGWGGGKYFRPGWRPEPLLPVLECSRRCSVQIWSPKERRATTQRASCWVSPPTSSALVCVSTWRGLRPRVERPEQDAAAFPARLGRGAGHLARGRVSAFRLGRGRGSAHSRDGSSPLGLI